MPVLFLHGICVYTKPYMVKFINKLQTLGDPMLASTLPTLVHGSFH